MGDIYSHAELTIAVNDSADCSEGCFRERSWTSAAILPLDLKIPGMISHWGRTSRVSRLVAESRPDQFGRYPSNSVLESRAWTLQEDLLSTRVLHCTNIELGWSCLLQQGSESSLKVAASAGHWLIDTKRALTRGTTFNGRALDPKRMLKLWYELIENYTKRKIAHTSDKLIALSGLQSRVGVILQDTPIVGGWRNQNFFSSLF